MCFYRHYRGGALINVIVRVYFDVFLFFYFLVGFYRHHRVYFIFKFCVFLGIIGGTPGKRISEGLFRVFFKLYIGGFYRHYRGKIVQFCTKVQ